MISKKEKQAVTKKLVLELKKAPVVAVASIAGLPARQYGLIKKKTRDNARIFFARQTLLARALDEAKPEASGLKKFFCNGAVLVTSNLNAFRLHKLFKQSMSRAFAKPGAVAPSDLVVPAGETSLTPGPVLTELKQAKIEAKIVGARVVIAKDAVVARKGERVNEAAARILAKLGIEVMEVGVAVKAVWEGGVLFEAAALDVDEAALYNQLVEARQQAVNLAVFARVYNETSTPLIIARAAREALALDALVKQKLEAAPAQQAPAEPVAPAPAEQTPTPGPEQ